MNVPSYDVLFTSRDKLVKTIIDLCEQSNKGGGGGGSDITEITSANKDAAIAAATNIVFKYGEGTVIALDEGHYIPLEPGSNPYYIGVYANINGRDIPLSIDYLFEFIRHLPYIFKVEQYKVFMEEEFVGYLFCPNAPSESFIFELPGGGPNASVICSSNFTSIPDLTTVEYVGEDAEYNVNTFSIYAQLPDGLHFSTIAHDFVKDDSFIEYGINNILVYKSESEPPGCTSNGPK